MDTVVSRRPCFIEEDDGLASLADMEAGFSGNHHLNNYTFFSRPLSYARKSSFLNLSSSSSTACFSPRSGPRFYDARYEEHQPYFLEACSLCKKLLGNRDIYMYRSVIVLRSFRWTSYFNFGRKELPFSFISFELCLAPRSQTYC